MVTKDFQAWEREVEEPIQWDDLREARPDSTFAGLSVWEAVTLLIVGVGSVAFMASAIVGGIVMWRWLT